VYCRAGATRIRSSACRGYGDRGDDVPDSDYLSGGRYFCVRSYVFMVLGNGAGDQRGCREFG